MGAQVRLRGYKLGFVGLLIVLMSCNATSNKSSAQNDTKTKKQIVPVFSSDSAYNFIKEQVEFGPRVPNTEAHRLTSEYLAKKLESFGADVIVQYAPVVAFDGTKLDGKNIIGQFQPNKNDRILLFAHWDSRPFADHDPDDTKKNKPIDGASDGASGVGVLLEIARNLNENKLPFGVDIIFFDAEDYGTPDHLNLPYQPDTWCLGSQYWGKNPHKENYYARYGILLDMVGAKGARFFKERFSMQMAPYIVDRVWQTASSLGYGDYFVYADGGTITDDHIYVNKHTGIPCVDIIQYDPLSFSGFGAYWHTHNDVLENIDKNTLKAVGQTLLEVLFNEE